MCSPVPVEVLIFFLNASQDTTRGLDGHLALICTYRYNLLVILPQPTDHEIGKKS